MRFPFGKNWRKYLSDLPPEALEQSRLHLCEMIGKQSLEGLSFLDVGSGSGLSSLAAFELGASVTSFDLDADSVECTRHLFEKTGSNKERWKILTGSALDESFLDSLGQFDIVYSWGVLHHTGDMWTAIDLVEPLVKDGGTLYLALYNDQGFRSKLWWAVKWLYNATPAPLQPLVFWPVLLRLWGPTTIKDLLKGQPFASWRSYAERGMSPMIDATDWIGGFPFEVASTEQVVAYLEARGYRKSNLRSVGTGLGCNEFVFQKAG